MEKEITKIYKKFLYFMKNKKLMPPLMKAEYKKYKESDTYEPGHASICNELKNYIK